MRARLPIFAFQSSQVHGAVVTLARDYRAGYVVPDASA